MLGAIISSDWFSCFMQLGIIRGVAVDGRVIRTASLCELRMGRGNNSSAQVDHLALIAVRISGELEKVKYHTHNYGDEMKKIRERNI